MATETEAKDIRWLPCDVEIATAEGPKTVPGIKHASLAPGLAITMSNDRCCFVVTHIASGLKVGGEFERIVNAMHSVLDLAPLADWTQDQAGMLAETKRRAESGESVMLNGGSHPVGYTLALTLARGTAMGQDEFPWEGGDDCPWNHLKEREDKLLLPHPPEGR